MPSQEYYKLLTMAKHRVPSKVEPPKSEDDKLIIPVITFWSQQRLMYKGDDASALQT